MSVVGFPSVEPPQDPLIVRLLRTMDHFDPDRIEDSWKSLSSDSKVAAVDADFGWTESLESTLIDRGLADEHQIAHAYGKHYLLPVFDPPADLPLPIDLSIGSLLSEEFCRRHRVVPLATEGDFLDVAVFAPESLLLSEEIQLQAGLHMRPMFSTLSVVERLLDTLYPKGSMFESSEFEPIDSPSMNELLAAETVRNTASNVPVDHRPNRYLSDLLNRAIRSGATAVHFDTVAGTPRIRLRLRGKLVDFDTPSTLELYEAMIQQIKGIGKLRQKSTSISTSGLIHLRRDGLCVDAAVHSLRTHAGEQIILKLNDGDKILRDLSTIGMSLAQQCDLRAAIRHPRGLVLFVGPAKSGRTTTQYACLNELNEPGTIQCTIERRVHESIDGAMQVSILDHPKRDWSHTFEACLQHDPDVVLVESIDDRSLAQRCVMTATFQQTILASLRATTAMQALGQLRQLGVDDGLASEALQCIVSQRRVRRLCIHCRQQVQLDVELAGPVGLDADAIVYQPRGCDACHGIGYSGSVGLFEVLTVDQYLRDAISRGVSRSELAKVIRELEVVTLQDSAIEKVLAGQTSLEEVQLAGLIRI